MSRINISLVINDADDDFPSQDPYVSPDGTILGRLGNVFEGVLIHANSEHWVKIAEYATRMSKAVDLGED